MPIQGLTVNRQASFPQLGILRKGAKKTAANKPGQDLHYFRFVTDDKSAESVFFEKYGAEPEEINILLPYPTVDQNFQAWKEDWAASSLRHRCDGETCVLHLTQSGKYSHEPIPCPGGCKQVGRLQVVVPAFQRLAYVTVLTTSIWDIINIYENLSALQAIRGDLRGVPLILRRKFREISTPAGDGRRARRAKSLITIEANPEWVALELAAQQQKALPGQAAPLALESAPLHVESGFVEEDDVDVFIGENPGSDDDDEAIEAVAEPTEVEKLQAEIKDIIDGYEAIGGESKKIASEIKRQLTAFDAVRISELDAGQLQELKDGLSFWLNSQKVTA